MINIAESTCCMPSDVHKHKSCCTVQLETENKFPFLFRQSSTFFPPVRMINSAKRPSSHQPPRYLLRTTIRWNYGSVTRIRVNATPWAAEAKISRIPHLRFPLQDPSVLCRPFP